MSLEQKYKIYRNEIFHEGLENIDFTKNDFITHLIDNSILLELRGWTKNNNKLNFDEFQNKIESHDDIGLNHNGPFSHQKLTFRERWS